MGKRYNCGMQPIFRRLLLGLAMIITTPIAIIGGLILIVWMALDWAMYELRRPKAARSR